MEEAEAPERPATPKFNWEKVRQKTDNYKLTIPTKVREMGITTQEEYCAQMDREEKDACDD